ncbi:protein FAM3D isoform X2 [Rousettus aegyptiacus]|uniref:FAM3 metabolism regulating signaling molecule D n=1 Tax=Rousettus aegyptiacus TaxID=9407 RepID=A0A7J8HQE3_ROUAE|nr:protein FAM3D isoform X2 [Rousettus aegyptiacus]KAF6474109.1 FAM3 metabolism regulating signaling molecule D [Rousettus aegyptiacus]
MRVSGLLRFLSLTFFLITLWIFSHSYTSFSLKNIRLPRWLGSGSKESPAVKTKCDLSKPCPANFFAFKICSGAANVVGPSICFEDNMIMSSVKNNVGRGLNIALVNGSTGMVLKKEYFDMYSGDPTSLVKFLKAILEDELVLVASYDDPGTKMNDEIRKLFSNLGSSYANQLGFRDSWVFLGARGIKSKSPFEQYLKNNPNTNKYEGWPELLELEGCVPRKVF